MKNKYNFLCGKFLSGKIIFLFLLTMLMVSLGACRLPGTPDEDPASTLRTYYQNGETAKATNHYIKYKLVAETSDISYPGVPVRTLPSQEESGTYDDIKHTLYHIALSDPSSTEYPLLTIDLISDGDWEFDVSDSIIAQHEDKVLGQICYGAGKFATFLYSIKDDTLTEIEPYSDLAAYRLHYLDGSEPFILASTIGYDIFSYGPITWYDWDGNILNEIDSAQLCFGENKLYYLTYHNTDELVQFDFYSANMDGTEAEKIGTIKEGYAGEDLQCFFWRDENITIGYEWKNQAGEQV